ncbi:probable 1-deoxy-D-xylulose-5-phosphate synthase, chloroplastic isoform X2 [Andrographis paniculata]|uniref:probable 1-deoxy-D-xylulose-5-phosphate synthase, chloroplastic isoform X2 n=1 Tax=Andrographis paniculata TaxID=175694 RepID=UPI0021E9138F|nr:probable 1-deoxy-D-xylulose-5-phosphate synthase, chloroplastic isoform X2 [Andrographis paniculata]
MANACCQNRFAINAQFRGNSRLVTSASEYSRCTFPSNVEFGRLNLHPTLASASTSKPDHVGSILCSSNVEGYMNEKAPTPMLDMVKNPMHLKNLTSKELRQLADDIRSELLFTMSETQKSYKPSLSVVELTVAIHHVFHSPLDKILWDVEEQTYPHKLLTGRRPHFHKARKPEDLSNYSCRSEFDPFAAGHGCSSISSGLGMAVARDIKRKRERIVAVISNETIMAGQVYEAMNNAGYIDSNMVVILNDSQQSLHPHPMHEQFPKASINVVSSYLSKLQSSKFFRKLRELAKALTKKIGSGMYEWAAKIDEYARGMLGPPGSTLFEELGLYYIGPVDGHNIEDLACVLREVASLNSMGPVLIHVITKDGYGIENNQMSIIKDEEPEGSSGTEPSPSNPRPQTYSDLLVESLVAESKRDEDIVVVHAGMGMEPSFGLLKDKLKDRFFPVGMAEQHAVTFSAGLSCGGLKPFCIIPSAFLQRAYDQVVHDVDRQKIPVRFAITSAGLAGSAGATHSGPFDITYMSCLPNMIVMAPSDETELARMVATAVHINDRPVCFRYPRGATVMLSLKAYVADPKPIEVGQGKLLVEGQDIALLGYGSMVQNCLRAHSLLSKLGIDITVADARFCKPLDIKLVRILCKNHKYLITVEEGSIGGFGAHVAQFISLDGLLDAGIKWRPITLPENYIEGALPQDQLAFAGLTRNHIAATALNLLGRKRDALLLMH